MIHLSLRIIIASAFADNLIQLKRGAVEAEKENRRTSPVFRFWFYSRKRTFSPEKTYRL
jgi:hypothetical protein